MRKKAAWAWLAARCLLARRRARARLDAVRAAPLARGRFFNALSHRQGGFSSTYASRIYFRRRLSAALSLAEMAADVIAALVIVDVAVHLPRSRAMQPASRAEQGSGGD